ncbi:4Fe-4S dicluster domain-containing protein [Methanococcoides alaskense]|uniref:Ferredoxin n=1 Tax=Methanococcoides alaskense TaxID=325778 RepID=A0AA90Z8I6_9EURY|nr:reductive dehalogenase domain-containing protein [Methanococcoides alaskense]MDR6223385.1 ferredoxin [Methanococcoides alaskense]
MEYDERDALFSRLQLKKGSKEYDNYYSLNPGNEEPDMKLKMKLFSNKSTGKGMPDKEKSGGKPSGNPFMKIGGDTSDHEYASAQLMQEYQRIASEVDDQAYNMAVNSRKREIPAETMSILIKEFVKLSGIDVVGITKVEPGDLYTHRGFNKKSYEYGEKVEHRFEYAIVFAAPLELDYINRGPNKELLMATMLGYAKSSELAARLVMYIKDLGYDAITDSSTSYESPLSFLGEKAGLGQMGRCNAVVNPKYGNRTKFAAVHTNLPLVEDEMIDFGLDEFCEICRCCEDNCPSKAISHESSVSEDGRKYWEHDATSCMEMWARMGTSCGVCMSACPFSQGVDEQLVLRMKGDKNVMDEILENHREKYGKRNYEKQPLAFMPKK